MKLEDAADTVCCGPLVTALATINAPSGLHCLAYKCMAWRWHHEVDGDGKIIMSKTEGYCGLAGTDG